MSRTDRQLRVQNIPTQQIPHLEQALSDAVLACQQAEKALAVEQAAVNAFRMHCRLTIGHWVDQLVDLRTEKQAYLTQIALLEQELGIQSEPETADSETEPPEKAEPTLAGAILEEYVDAETEGQAEKRLYRELARRFHPDLSANDVEKAYRSTMMAAVNVAYAQHDIQTLRDLAGELDPQTVADIEQIPSRQVRQLRQKIARCERLRRKANAKLEILRGENTAKLWRQAQQLDVTGDSNWWQEVKLSLRGEIERLVAEVAALAQTVQGLETAVSVKADERASASNA